MKALVLILCLAFSSSAFAKLTDYQCVNDCTAEGSLHSTCVERCSTKNGETAVFDITKPRSNGMKFTDFVCVNKCTANGYVYTVCKDQCTN